ncbi:MAG: site-2 protease family protein [Candidatus Hodarchaeales archaeon]
MDAFVFLLLIAFSWFFLLVITNNRWVKLKNPEIGLGYALFRTKRFNQIIDRVAGVSGRFWRFLFDIGLLVSLGFLLATVGIFIINLFKFLQLLAIDLGFLAALPDENDVQTVDLVPAIPGVSISFKTLPYFAIAIAIAAASHELAHGVSARAEKIKVKSTGLMFFLFFFGAFVEPDEASLKKAASRQKLRVYAAGAFINLLIVLLFLPLLLTPVFQAGLSVAYDPTPQGALILEVCPSEIDNCPAKDNIFANDVIIKAIFENGSERTISSNVDFAAFSRGTKPGELINLYFLDKDTPIPIITAPHPENSSRGIIGVQAIDYYKPHDFFSFLPIQLPYWTLNIIFYTMSLSLVLALLNLLPVPPLDGDKIVSTLLEHFNPNNYQFYLKWVRLVTLVIFLGNLLLTFLIRGWVQV